MLPRYRRLRTKDINRLFGRNTTRKIIAYPFVFFVGEKRTSSYKTGDQAVIKNQPQAGISANSPRTQNKNYTQRAIQISNKFSKSSVKRHILKRSFYDTVERSVPIDISGYYILAVPQKTWQEEMTQILETHDKTTIVATITKQYNTSLSSLRKKLGSQVSSKMQ